MSRKSASAQSAPWARPSKSEAATQQRDGERGAAGEPEHRVAQGVVVGAGEHEEADVGDAEDAEGEGEGQRQVAEGLRHAERGDQQRRHRAEDDQPHGALLGVDHAGQPGVADPGPPEHAEHQQPLAQPRPGRVVGHQRRALGDREDEDEVEEELQRRDPLALAPDGAQSRSVGLGLGRGGQVAHPCKSPAGAGRSCRRRCARRRARSRAEDPEPQQQVAQQRRQRVGGQQYGELDPARRPGRQRFEGQQAAAGQQQAEAEDEQALDVVAEQPLATAPAEGEAPVGGGVGDRREPQRGRVGGERREHRAQRRGRAAK